MDGVGSESVFYGSQTLSAKLRHSASRHTIPTKRMLWARTETHGGVKGGEFESDRDEVQLSTKKCQRILVQKE